MRRSRSTPVHSFRWAKRFSVLTLLAAPSVAQAGIDDLAGTKPGDLDFGGQFENADTCALCHGGGYNGDRSYLPHDSWAGTMMANAARDPVFRAALTLANQDEPGVGTFCLRCHSPIAFVRGHATPPDGSAFDAVDKQGIGCDTCHRAITSGPTDAPYFVGNAQIVYSNELSKRGPYADSVVPVHATIADPQLSTSHFCGQCHQVTNPGRLLRDASGNQTNLEFPLDTTYQEWQASDFAAPDGSSCLDCHVQRREGDVPVATSANAPLRKSPRNHAFVGANQWGIRAVMAADPARANAYPDAFAEALGQTKTLLESAVKVQFVSAPTEVTPGMDLHVDVRVENLSGHKFPTGYAEGRRAWMALVLLLPNGEETFLRGGYDETTGEIVNAASTHVYRAQHGFWNGFAAEASEDLARHDMILSDTRIPPKGFVAAPGTFPTAEIDYGDQVAGFRHYDEASFDLTIPMEVTGDIVLSARIYYQSITRAYIEHLAQANSTDSTGQDLLQIYEMNGDDKPTLVGRHDAPISIVTAAQSSSVSSVSSGMAGAGGGAVSTPPGCDCGTSRKTSETFGVAISLAIAFLTGLRRVRVSLSRR